MTDISEQTAPPSTGWVVHEVFKYVETDANVWAWCKVGVDAPGYTEIYFTETDGQTPADAPGSAPGALQMRLGRVLFKVWC